MRGPEDIISASVTVHGVVEVDMERVEQDPIWETVARTYDLSDLVQKKEALVQYLCRYLGNEVLLECAPMTNGPAATISTNAEVK